MTALRLPHDETVRLALSRQQAANALGVSLAHFKARIQPELRPVYSGRLRLFPIAELERWLIENQGARPSQRNRGAA